MTTRDDKTEPKTLQCGQHAAQDSGLRLAELTRRLMQMLPLSAAHHMNALSGREYTIIDYPGIADAFGKLAVESLSHPAKALKTQSDLIAQSLDVVRRALNGTDAATNGDGATRDRRFKHKAWSEEPFYRCMRDVYLSNADKLTRLVLQAESLNAHEKDKALFYTRQLISALSPANFPWLNPQVAEHAKAEGLGPTLSGLENFVQDLERGSGQLQISQTDEAAFEIGRNLATTPGKVVYRNDLIELIQYEPSTKKVFDVPFLMVPPWINKYYVLDLQPENSFLKWLVDQGHTVFLISWVNPGKDHAQKGFEDYMREGPLAAIDVVRQVTGAKKVNIGGFCIGGILTLCALAWMTAKGQVPVRSASLLATMFDLSEIGDCSVFIDEEQIASIEKHAGENGYLDGRHMMNMFSMLRENDLIWNYVVNNYLLGRQPKAFDILYWNADCTRLPARMLIDYLRDIVMKNGLARQGALVLGGVPIDISSIETPCYFLSTIDDHIAPWKATFPVTKILSGPCEFVLAGSGHIAGIVNPPKRKKYSFRTGTAPLATPEDWLKAAEEHEGSWWPHWAAWLSGHAGKKVPARSIGSKDYPALCDAPGTFVLERSAPG